jgi:predicted Zn-dependent protease
MNSQPKILNRLVTIVLLAVIASGCSTTPTGRKQLTMKSNATLAADGARAMAQIRAGSALVKDQPTIDYVACVADAIVGTLDDKSAALYWEMAIVNNPVVNAYVMPGGKIVVQSGIMSVADNQHQLATVLGHEVAHVTANHTNERATRSDLSSFGTEVLARVLIGDSLNRYSRNYDPNRAYGIYGMAGTVGKLGLLNPFSRMQESEADEIGILYMAKAGFDPRESVELWKKMGDKTANVPAFLSTHPTDESRTNSMISYLPEALVLYNQAKEEGRTPDCEPQTK